MCKDQISFDEGLSLLEAAVQKLEGGALGLEEAMQCYEDGMKLSAALQEKLSAAQRRVEVLRQGPGGEYYAESLEGVDE
jgi:exodeoxyribonuclease VII small subunit